MLVLLFIGVTQGTTTYVDFKPNADSKLDLGTNALFWERVYSENIIFDTNNVVPDEVGELLYDNTVAGMSGGALRWYDDNSVRMIVDLETDPSNDDYIVAYDADADGFYMADAAGVGYTQAEIEDFAGGLVSGNTETLITVTYQEADNTLDFVVDNDLHNYSWTNVDGTDLKTGSITQAYDAGLTNLAAVGMAADKFYYTSADNVHVAADITAYGRSILDDADEATFKATTNLETSVDVRGYEVTVSLFGPNDTDGSWRINVDGDNLEVERYDTDTWTTKFTFTKE